jgi:nucleotide-binding universal stress UspA family protein
VTDGVVHRTTGPLVVVPDAPVLGVTRILLGLDGSAGAAAAARWCATFASVLDADVVAAFVYTQQLELVPEQDPTSAYHSFEHALRADWTAPLRDRQVRLTMEIVHDPSSGDGLLRAADDADVDLVVVGTHRRNPLTHVRLGGTAMRLVHSTARPLALVPPD